MVRTMAGSCTMATIRRAGAGEDIEVEHAVHLRRQVHVPRGLTERGLVSAAGAVALEASGRSAQPASASEHGKPLHSDRGQASCGDRRAPGAAGGAGRG
jgi:hypothetical protein